MIDFFATQPHYVDHLIPVWRATPERERGGFMVSPDVTAHLRHHGVEPATDLVGDVRVAAGWRDAASTPRRVKLVLMEHGTGQTYEGHRPAYAGGAGRERVALFLAPNQRVLELNKQATPRSEHALVGCPKLDAHFARPQSHGQNVCVSFHYDSPLCNETTSGFKYFRDGVRPEWLMHSHPRDNLVERWARGAGWSYVEPFSVVLATSHVYCCDNSSTMYEFAALDRPVVVLNPPQYRRDVEHGLRFWEYADVGVNCDHPNDIQHAVELAFDDVPSVRERRSEITEALYPVRDGSAAERAADAICGVQ